MIELTDIASAAAGGLTGLLGSVVGRVAGYFEEKQKTKRLQIELDHELKLQDMQLKDKQAEREHEAEIVFDGNATESLIGSYEHDSSYNGSALRWVRPVLTLLLIGLTFWVYDSLPDQTSKADIGSQIVYLTTVAISWWFADRSGRANK